MVDTYLLIALFFSSIAEIAYEIIIMRIFSVGGWSNFGSLVISTALLGIGLSGIVLTLVSDWVRKNARILISGLSIAVIPAMGLAVYTAQLVPFNPLFMASDPRQFWFICSYFVIYGIPFFIGSAFIGVIFIVLHENVRKLYSCNLLGAGLGGFLILLVMFVLPTQLLVLPILVVATLASFFACLERPIQTMRPYIPTIKLAAISASVLVAGAVTLASGEIRVSEYKPISYVRKYPDAKLVHHSYGPAGEFHVYASSYLHFAPGLSDNAALNLSKMPRQPFWGLYIDGSGPIGIMGDIRNEDAEYMNYLPMAAPYSILARPKVLLVNLGGGINAQVARFREARSIDIVEPSEEMVRLIRDDPNVSRFTGDLLKSPGINVQRGDPRAHCVAHPGAYDLVEISLIDSIGQTDSGGYAVKEDYSYSVDAVHEYMKALKEEGILSISIWDRLNPPRNVPRLLNTIVTALREAGVEHPESRIFAFNLYMSTATVLVKNSDFTEGEIYDLKTFAAERSFTMIHYPGMVSDGLEIGPYLKAYAARFSGGQDKEIKDFNTSDFYRAAFREFIAGRSASVEKAFVFDIRPIRDSRPYYSGYLKLGKIGFYLPKLGELSEEWGYLLILGVLIYAILFGVAVVAVPVAVRWRSLFKNRKGTAGVIAYYASLGIAYMLIEIFLIQRFGVYLSNPTYSTSVVITTMLICSALGNLASGLVKIRRDILVAGAAGLVALILGFMAFGLDGVLAPTRSASLALRFLVAVGIIGPLAFFMGIPYPNGLDTLQRNRPHLLPWAWGMNGGLSVAGTALAKVIAVSAGFPVLLGLAVAFYLAIGALYRVNEASKEEALPTTETSASAG
jgi:hypothetical protein